MSKNAKGFCMFFDWVEDLDQLGDSDGAWQIVKALSEYFKNGKNPVEAVTGPLRVVAALMYHQIMRSEAKAIAGRKGAEVTNSKKRIDKQVHFADGNRRHTAATETETITETISIPDTIINNYNLSIPEGGDAHTHTHENESGKSQTFGKFQNIYLLPAEYDDLCRQYGKPATDELIEKMSARVKAKGYHYDNHYAALLCWAATDNLEPVTKTATSYDVDEFFLTALSATQTKLNEKR